MKHLLLALALVFAASLPASARSAEQGGYDAGDPAENKAVRVVAMQFLTEIDEGRVGGTWPMVGDYLRGILTRSEWEKGIADARAGRAPAGRDLMGAVFTKTLEDQRDGHFFIVVYRTRYGSQWFQERVVLTRQGTQWKVDGYWMLPADESGQTIGED